MNIQSVDLFIAIVTGRAERLSAAVILARKKGTFVPLSPISGCEVLRSQAPCEIAARALVIARTERQSASVVEDRARIQLRRSPSDVGV